MFKRLKILFLAILILSGSYSFGNNQIQKPYYSFSVDRTSFNVPVIDNEEKLKEALSDIENLMERINANDSTLISKTSYKNTQTYIAECRANPNVPLSEKIHLNKTIKSIYISLGCYNDYSYSYGDLVTRRKIMKQSGAWFSGYVSELEGRGGAMPVSVSEEYKQYVAEYGTESAYFLGQQYEGMTGIVYAMYGIHAAAHMHGENLRTIAGIRQKIRNVVKKANKSRFEKR